ncbi:hypothetical protein E2562_023309 [Oryza meyeriana var. granulata]|uniref:Uncharacterized protein n=1 Tax=Oryza meyeriana var. granulata TaxID=110450 RepID=A0A6G1DMC7_9ORYZ|nr:hypothetical protein E2562_023309 [Oryza meyeriana var. granulata]
MASKPNTQVGFARWASRLVAEDFSRGCKEDRFCVDCLAAFCGHCCGGHLHVGHEVVRVGASTSTSARVSPRSGGAKRDSFCMDRAAGFSSALCDHHGGHETVRVVLREGQHCVRCTGSEPWFEAFDGIMTYKDESGGVLVPLRPRRYSSLRFGCCRQ